MSDNLGKDILIVAHKLAPCGDNAVCAAHKICSLLLQNGGKVLSTTITPESWFSSSIEDYESKNLVGGSSLKFISPNEPKPKDNPAVPWIAKLHCSYYNSFSHDDERLDNVGYIVGFVPTTAETAVDLQDRIRYKAMAYRKRKISPPKVVLINCSKIDEDQSEVIDDMEDYVKKADVIFSIGNRLFDHYEALYSGYSDSETIRQKHQEFIFRPNSVFLNEEWRAPSFIKLASFWNKGTYYSDAAGTLLQESSVEDYRSVCKTIGYLASDSKLRGVKVPEWYIHAMKHSLDEKQNLATLNKTVKGEESFLVASKPEITDEKSLLRIFRSHTAIIAPEYNSDGFNFQAWEAIGFGIPTYVADQSGIAATIKKVCSLVNFQTVVKLFGSYKEDVARWKQHIVSQCKDPNSRPESWAARLRDELLESAYLIESEKNFVSYFGLCRSTDYQRRYCYLSTEGVRPHKAYQESAPDPRFTEPEVAASGAAGGDSNGASQFQTPSQSSSSYSMTSSASGQPLQLRVELKMVKMLGSDGKVTSPAEILGRPEINANEHFCNSIKRQLLASDSQQVESWEQRQLERLEEMRTIMENDNYELLRVVCSEDNCPVMHLLDFSHEGENRMFSEKVKNSILRYAATLGIDTNEVHVTSLHETRSDSGDAGVSESDDQRNAASTCGGDNNLRKVIGQESSGADAESTLSAQFSELGIAPPGTDLTSLQAQSIPHMTAQSAENEGGARLMETQASLEDGSYGTLPPKNESLQGAAGGGSTAQADQIDRPATPVRQEAVDELETTVKQTKDTSFPAGGKLSKNPGKHDATYQKYKWFDWQKFKLLRAKTGQWIQSAAFRDKLKPIVVAVIDTGMYEGHPDLRNKVLTNHSKCFVQDPASQNDLRIDQLNHGTVVAGVIALNGPINVKIINLKVQPVGGRAGDMRDLVKALEHIESLDEEVHIVNMSMGQHDLPPGLSQAVNRLADHKVLIASAGNYAAKGANTITYPGLHSNVICVGACDFLGHMTPISSQGREVDFLCPGKDVVSTANNGGYYHTNGTSFASPHACAVAAHVLVALQALAAQDPQFEALINSAPTSIYSTSFMRNFLVRMCTKSEQPDSQGQGHGVLMPHENGFRDDFLLKDHCKIALTGRSTYVSP